MEIMSVTTIDQFSFSKTCPDKPYLYNYYRQFHKPRLLYGYYWYKFVPIGIFEIKTLFKICTQYILFEIFSYYCKITVHIQQAYKLQNTVIFFIIEVNLVFNNFMKPQDEIYTQLFGLSYVSIFCQDQLQEFNTSVSQYM